MLKVLRKLTVLDKFKAKWKVAEVEYSGLPEWVDLLVAPVPAGDLRLALDRYAEPLLRSFRYTPAECLDRVPTTSRTCMVYKGCFGWDEKKCLNLKKNTCQLLLIGPDENSTDLTVLVNLWREGYYVVTAKTES